MRIRMICKRRFCNLLELLMILLICHYVFISIDFLRAEMGKHQVAEPKNEITGKLRLQLKPDSFDYSYIITPDNKTCSNRVLMVIMIMSESQSYRKRQSIRRGWACEARLRQFELSLLFAIGTSVSNESSILHKEQADNGDLLWNDLAENMTSRTLQVASGIQWITDHCSNVPFILKTDEDQTLNLEAIMSVAQMAEPMEKSVRGHLVFNQLTERIGNKSISVKIWPHKTVPAYFTGEAQMFTMVALKQLVTYYHRVPFLVDSDVWLTGFVAQLARLKKLNVSDYENWIFY